MHPGISSWKNLLVYAFNLFSIPLFLRTLFSPLNQDSGEGSNFSIIEKIVFAIFSRLLGFSIRFLFIILGLVFTFLVFLTFPIFFFFPIKISRESLAKQGSFGSFLSFGNTFYLNKIGRNIEKINNIELYGKERYLRMIERALSKDNNHNVLLIGESGVGKETIIDYLGLLGTSGLSFSGIKNHRVVEIILENINKEDLLKALNEARKAKNIILVFKNIHLYESIFPLLIPFLNDKYLAIIATTDFSSYDQVLKRNGEFLLKFEKVEILATDKIETLNVLVDYTNSKKIKIKEEVLRELVNLTDKYIFNQAEPQKSISILEELQSTDREINLDDIRQIISDKTNIPIGDLSLDERKVLMELEDTMKEKIIGQDEAVEDLSLALKRMRSGVADPSRPAGSFLFLGSTGVGKTYTAKILAESYFGRKDAMVRFDMSEFAGEDSMNLFVDRLASVIEEYPLSLVFFDELEKANRVVHNVLLQVLDEGHITRASGRKVSLKNSIIIATSNAGSKDLVINPKIEKKILIDELIKNDIFTPEFLNRFSDVVLFRPLGEKESRDISALLLSELASRILKDKNITLVITPELVEKVAKVGFDPDFGARPIKRAIEEIVENKIADYILRGNNSGTIKIL